MSIRIATRELEEFLQENPKHFALLGSGKEDGSCINCELGCLIDMTTPPTHYCVGQHPDNIAGAIFNALERYKNIPKVELTPAETDDRDGVDDEFNCRGPDSEAQGEGFKVDGC